MGQEQSKYNQLTNQLVYLNKKGYKFIGYLGKGVFGLVIQAYSQEHGNVAVKILDKKVENVEEIFEETSEMEKLLNCENIVKIYECLNCSTLRDVAESNQLSLTYYIATPKRIRLDETIQCCSL